MFMFEKKCIKNIGIQYSLEKNEAANMFFLEKTQPIRVQFLCWHPCENI